MLFGIFIRTSCRIPANARFGILPSRALAALRSTVSIAEHLASQSVRKRVTQAGILRVAPPHDGGAQSQLSVQAYAEAPWHAKVSRIFHWHMYMCFPPTPWFRSPFAPFTRLASSKPSRHDLCAVRYTPFNNIFGDLSSSLFASPEISSPIGFCRITGGRKPFGGMHPSSLISVLVSLQYGSPFPDLVPSFSVLPTQWDDSFPVILFTILISPKAVLGFGLQFGEQGKAAPVHGTGSQPDKPLTPP
mmetsp:Transcript_38733/g.64237  ORF Transcript_38733/g.64237 Transcript_38733/m.64237 type:complete len:246 (-) Transcript_38733:1327-2064(-)